VAVAHVDYQLRDLTVTAIAAYSGYNTAILNDVMLTGGRNEPGIGGPWAAWIDALR